MPSELTTNSSTQMSRERRGLTLGIPDAVGNSRHGYEAYEQLAIYYEHKARDPEQAQQIVRQALNKLRRAFQVGDLTPGAYREFKARFDRRMERLERKSRKPLLDVLAMQPKA